MSSSYRWPIGPTPTPSCSVQGYGMLVDPLCMLGYSDIPETEQLYGGGALNFLKLAGAAGTLYERPRHLGDAGVAGSGLHDHAAQVARGH